MNGVRSEWTLANNKNNELCNQVFGDMVGRLTKRQYERYYSTNPNALEAFLQRKEQGLDLSDRVWRYTNQFKEEIEMGLDIGIRDGLSADEMSRRLRQYLQNPDALFRRVRDEHGLLHLSKAAKAYHPGQGVYRSAYKNARRLTATECNIAYRTSDYERWQLLDFVVGVRVVLSNNHTLNGVSFIDICDELSAPLGSKATSGRGCYPKDFKFTGWHPHCRCHAESILKTREEMQADNEAMLAGGQPSPTSRNTVTDVPEEFKAWVRDNQERMASGHSIPYFIRDNSTYVQKELHNLGKEATKATQKVARTTLAELQNEWFIYTDEDQYEACEHIQEFDLVSFKKEASSILSEYNIDLDSDSWKANIYSPKTWGFSINSKELEMTRTFMSKADGIEVHHDYFTLTPSLQGKGISKKLFRVLYQHYRQADVRYMTVFANINVGGYTWAKYGFQAESQGVALRAIRGKKEVAEQAKQLVLDWYKTNNVPASEPFPMRLLAEQPWGKDVLLNSHWEGKIDLHDKKQREIFEAYIGLR